MAGSRDLSVAFLVSALASTACGGSGSGTGPTGTGGAGVGGAGTGGTGIGGVGGSGTGGLAGGGTGGVAGGDGGGTGGAGTGGSEGGTCVPTTEVCDGKDNDCDGTVDNGNPGGGAACSTGLQGECAAGTLTCQNGALACVQNVQSAAETCDGKDNDCNGTVDNGNPGGGAACNTGLLGVCSAGTTACTNGAIACNQNVQAATEVCDGLDNDCNGTADNGNPGGGTACNTGLLGVCSAGTTACTNGTLTCLQNTASSSEQCNGLDDDCNGTADNGNPGGGAPCGCGGAGTTVCQNGAVVCSGGPNIYFEENFSDNSKGWTLGTQWAIAPASASTVCAGCPGQDPATDHTPTSDNGVAGQVVGGCVTTVVHADYCIESPTINLASAPGSVYMSFWRHLHSDYPIYATNSVQVYTGSVWSNLWVQTTGGVCINDTAWTSISGQTQFDVTAYKNANFRVRWCSNIGAVGAYAGGGWSIDDVVVSSALCP